MKDLTPAAGSNSPMIPGTSLTATSTPLDHPELWHRYFQGHRGQNRTDGYNQIADATDDYLAVQCWLRKAENSSRATYLNYRKEANRFLAWAALTRDKRLSDITASDLEAYQRFLLCPEPASIWVSKGGRPSKHAAGWRAPFSLWPSKPEEDEEHGEKRPKREKTVEERIAAKEYGLSRESVITAMASLKSLFSYLHKVGYLKGSPFIAVSEVKEEKEVEKVNRRNLTNEEVDYVLATIEAMPRESKTDIKAYARTRWLFCLLIYVGLRRSEVAKGRMSDFFHCADGTFLQVKGKGRKKREVPITIRVKQELAAYRATLGKSPWPSRDDDSPLVARLVGDDSALEEKDPLSAEIPNVISPVTVWKIVHSAFTAAAQRALDEGNKDLGNSLRAMSTHWLRHTFGTDSMRRLGSAQEVQMHLGHSSILTTMQYSHVEREKRSKNMDTAYADTILSEKSGTKP